MRWSGFLSEPRRKNYPEVQIELFMVRRILK
jgi:hypothetical protein